MLSLESPEYVEQALATWPVLPDSMIVIEFAGRGDSFFGGNADDRPLCDDGVIGNSTNEAPAVFETVEAAHEAAKAVSNRRPGSILGVVPTWRRPQ